MESAPRIAIIGAGPTSLTLASLLSTSSISYTVYEASTSLRHSGGSLDIHPKTGQAALKAAGLLGEFQKRARPESDVFKILELTGEVLFDENELKKEEGEEKSREERSGDEFVEGRPEIDRKDLLEILRSGVPTSNIEFGKKLLKIVENQNDAAKHDLHFADGTVEEGFDLVVGADGAWSRVRALLSNVTSQYSGISMVELWINEIKGQGRDWVRQYVGEGSCFASGEGCAIISQRQGDGGLRTYACLRVDEDFVESCGIDWSKADAARNEYLDRYLKDIGDDLKRLVRESDDYLVPRVLYELPVGFKWDHRPGVTLIGDAAHLMTPFAGMGVNVGMTDALFLAQEIIKARKGEQSLNDAVRAYEEELFPRVEKAEAKTFKNKVSVFSSTGAREIADLMQGHKG